MFHQCWTNCFEYFVSACTPECFLKKTLLSIDYSKNLVVAFLVNLHSRVKFTTLPCFSVHWQLLCPYCKLLTSLLRVWQQVNSQEGQRSVYFFLLTACPFKLRFSAMFWDSTLTESALNTMYTRMYAHTCTGWDPLQKVLSGYSGSILFTNKQPRWQILHSWNSDLQWTPTKLSEFLWWRGRGEWNSV